MDKSIILYSLAVLLAASSCSDSKTQKKDRQDKVIVAQLDTIRLKDRTLTSEFAATLSGCQTVEIRPQVSGMITGIYINEGDVVKKGEILFTIDQAPYKAAYEKAVASVQSAEAAVSNAELQLSSNQELYDNDVISEIELDTSKNDVAKARATLALAHAEEREAHNNLSYTEVKSPVNGIASMINYRIGALVSNTIQQPLVTVSDDSEIYAYFSMTESQVLDLTQKHGSLRQAISNMPDVRIRMINGEIYPENGRIDAISGLINGNTGSLSVRAVFPNAGRILRDGGSGSVMIPTVRQNSIVIPQSATYELQDRKFVYKVVDGVANASEIHVLAQNNGKEYVVTDGLDEGDVIIAEGAGLIRDGQSIKAKSQTSEASTEKR